MAQATSNSAKIGQLTPSNVSAASNQVPKESLLEYLNVAAKAMRRTELSYGIMMWLTMILFVISASVLIDHWIWEFHPLARFAVLASLIVWTIWWIPKKILPPLLHSINTEHAARAIEQQFPECKNSLISWLQLSGTDSASPKGVLAYVGRYAVRNLKGQDANSIVDSSTIVRLSAAFFGCLLCGMIYLFASPKSGFTSIARMLAPWADIAPATRVNILEVIPGTATVTQGGSLPLSVTVRGMHQGEGVRVRFDLSDGQMVGETVPMIPEIQMINYKLDFGKSFGGIHQPLKYWILAGDAIAGPFDVSVQVVPMVAVETIELNFPPYTKLKPRTLVKQGSFETPEGTKVELVASTNQSMKKARLEFDPVLEEKSLVRVRDTMELSVDENSLKGNWVALLDDKKSNPTTTQYRIKATNELNESNPDPILYQFKVIGDLPPEVLLDSSLAREIEVPVDASMQIEIRANDPDYGLTEMAVSGNRPAEDKLGMQKELFRQVCFESEQGENGVVVQVFELRPADLGLKAGDQFDFFASASDNRHDPVTGGIAPNQTASSPLRIKVVAPQASSEGSDGNDKKPPQEADGNSPQIPPQDPNTKVGNSKPNSTNDRNRPSQSNQGGRNTDPSNGKGAAKQPSDSKEQDGNSGDKNTQPKTGDSPDNSSSDNSQGESRQSNNQAGNSKQGGSQSKDNSQNNKRSQGDNAGGEQGSESSSDANESGNGKAGSQKKAGGNGQGAQEGDRSNPSSDGGANSNTGSSAGNQSDSESADTTKSGPPSHDAEAFERINQFRKEKEQQSGTSEGESIDRGQDGDSAGQQSRKQGKGPGDPASNTNNNAVDKPNEMSSEPDKTGGDKTGGDKTGGDKTGGDKTGGDKTGGDKTGGDKTGGDKTGGDKTGGDKTGGDKTGGDKTGGDKTGGDKTGGDKTGGDKTGGDKTGGDKTGGDKTGGDKAGGDKAGGDKAGGDKAGGDKAGGDKAGGDKAGGDKAGGDKAGGDKAGGDKAGGDKAGGDKTGGDKTGGDKTGGDKTGGDKAGGDKTGGDKTGGDKAGGDKTGGDKTGGDKTGGDKTGGDKTGGDKTGGDKTGGDKAGGDKAGGDKAGGDKAGGDKAGGDKTGGDKTGGDKTGGDKTGGDKTGGDKTGGDKAGGDKAGGDKAGGDKAGGDKTGGKPSPAGQKSPQAIRNPDDNDKGAKNGQPGMGGGNETGSEDGPAKDGSKPSNAGSGVNRSGKTPESSAGDTGPGTPSVAKDFGAEKANLDYADKTTDMVLEYLDRQRDQPDPELLKKLNWTPEDLRKFSDRWRAAKDQARKTPEKKEELDAALRALGLRSPDQKVNRLKDKDDNLRGMQESGGRLRPPESIREQFEAFRKAAGKLDKSP